MRKPPGARTRGAGDGRAARGLPGGYDWPSFAMPIEPCEHCVLRAFAYPAVS